MNIYCELCRKKALVVKAQGDQLTFYCSDIHCGNCFTVEVSFKRSISNHMMGAKLKGDKVTCGCGGKTTSYKNNKLSSQVSDAYHKCKSCGHKFVMTRFQK